MESMKYPLSYALDRAKEKWSPRKRSVKFYTVFGAGSLISGAIACYVGHMDKLVRCSGFVLLATGTTFLLTALKIFREENFNYDRLLKFRALPRPSFYPLLKRYLELQFEKENITFLKVDEVASDFVFFVKMRTGGYEVKVNDDIDQATQEYLTKEIARLESTKYSNLIEDSSSKALPNVKSGRDTITSLHALREASILSGGFIRNHPNALSTILSLNIEERRKIVEAEYALVSRSGTSQITQVEEKEHRPLTVETPLQEPAYQEEKLNQVESPNDETSQLTRLNEQIEEACIEKTLLEKYENQEGSMCLLPELELAECSTEKLEHFTASDGSRTETPTGKGLLPNETIYKVKDNFLA